MTPVELLLRVEKILQMEPDTLTVGPPNNELGTIDSLAALSLIALANEKFGVILKAKDLYALQKTDQLIELIGPQRLSPGGP